ncbi:MAG: heat-inducible transcription repressor HrcA [Oscillospiraceae bacterium]|nr:heat-inducible transcription repressor HrcA [Oscillospiraceae bacterium]
MDDRKLKILAAVVDEYILTGEPVGSKAIMQYIEASSATIRNEMAELEKQGFLEQPHTSAGRVPTYAGYRLYVDRLLKTSPISTAEKRRLNKMLQESDYSESALVETAQNALAELTNCAVFASGENPKFSVISKVEVIPTGKRIYVLLMVTSTGKIQNRTCRLELDLTHEQLKYFSDFVKENLEGVPLEVLSDEMLSQLETALGTYLLTLSPLMKGIFDMSREISKRDVSLYGERNLLTCSDMNQSEIISFLDNSQELRHLIDDSFSGIHVTFSQEADGFVIGNSSLISSNFSKDGVVAGHLGVIGPMRINYKKVIPYLEYLTDKITKMLSSDESDEE